MQLDEKYLSLLNLLVYDKRSKMDGMISGIVIRNCLNRVVVSYEMFISRIYANTSLFIEDIEKGNVVFLLPFVLNYQKEMFEKMAEDHEKRIREFFGDKFREDMVMRISEDDRQEEIRKWDNLTKGLEHWDNKLKI